MSGAAGVSVEPQGSPQLRSACLSAEGSGSSEEELRAHASGRASSRTSQLGGARKPSRPHTPAAQASAPPAAWNMVLDALSELREEVNKLKEGQQSSPHAAPGSTVVNLGASTSRGTCGNGARSPDSFVGFAVDYGSEDGEMQGVTQGCSTLLQGAKSFGPPELVSEEIDPQVAEMINYLFDNGMRKITETSVRMTLSRGQPTVTHSLRWSATHRYLKHSGVMLGRRIHA